MTLKNVKRKMCDVDNCEHEACHSCALCNLDLCHSEHTHEYGDGRHLEHSIRVRIRSMDYQGDGEFWLCPKCYVESPFYSIAKQIIGN